MTAETTEPEEKREPIGSHIEELRRRLVRALIAVAVATTAAFVFAPALFRWLLHPYHSFLSRHGTVVTGAVLQTLEPSETLKMSFELSLIIGVAVVAPYLLYEIWCFVRPGLTSREKRWIFPALAGGVLLFFCGVLFAYYAVLPIGLEFFWEYSLRLGITPAWSVAHYVDFVIGMLAAFGIAFELPIVTLLLAAIGLVTPKMLTDKRRYAYFIIAVLAAVLTPPDALSMTLMGIPMLGLYELSILLAKIVARDKVSASS